MTTRHTLRFVQDRAEAGPQRPSTDVVVLDTSWTPEPGERSDLIPVRPIVRDVLDRVNLFDESLERLDAWGEAADMGDRLMVGGVTWWFHARSFIRLDLHEMLLWAHVLADVAPPGRYARIEMPAIRGFLVQAARSSTARPAPVIATYGPPAMRRSAPAATGSLRAFARLAPYGVRRPVVLALRKVGFMPDFSARMALLEERLEALKQQPPAVMAVVRTASFHVIEDEDGAHRVDPYVTPVLNALEADGHQVVSIGLAVDIRERHDWEVINGEPRMLPMSFLSRREPLPRGDGRISADANRRLRDIPRLSIDVEGFDLGPAIRSITGDLGLWFEKQRHGMLWAERVIETLQPSALFTGWEGARTMWLGAAHRLGVPTVAVQHGVIYPNNPDYYRPAHPGLVRPDVTCVYGPYERDLLLDGGRYKPGTVVVSGSPRVRPDDAPMPATPDERDEVRAELGVADGDRLLVLSAARNPVGDEMHAISMAARLLDGPLPGVHVVVKLHPEEESGDPYERLLTGLARAGGYAPPALSIVRDMDLYRLLRAADAHLGLYSTVLTDAVLTGTPNMIAVGQAYADAIGYVPDGVAVPVATVDDVRAFMADPRPPTREARARFVEEHYRGGDATQRIATAITDLIGHAEPAIVA